MRKGNSVVKGMVILALLLCALALGSGALAEGDLVCVEFTHYADGTVVAESYSVSTGAGYALKDYMVVEPWSFMINTSGANTDLSSGQIYSAIEAGMREWNSNMSQPKFSMNNTTTSLVAGVQDYNNVISFGKLDSGVLARTTAWYDKDFKLPEGYPATYLAVEADIVFNNQTFWTDVSAGGNGYDMQSLATHELGHTLGLADVYNTNYAYATMYGLGYANDIAARSLASPDLQGLSQYYNVPGYGGPGELPPLPTPTPVPTETPAPSATPAPVSATVNSGAGGLNLRTQPNTTGTVITVIPHGANVTIMSQSGDWSYIEYLTNTGVRFTGYAMTQYLQVSPNTTPTPSTQPSAQPSAQPSVTPTVTATPAPTEMPDEYATVNATSLNMRAQGSMTATIICQIPGGDKVRLISYSADWSYVEYNGLKGYVSSQYLVRDGAVATPTPAVTPGPDAREATVNVQTLLNMRRQPNLTSGIVTQIPGGKTVYVISESNGWSYIKYGSYTGYVSSQYLKYNDGGSTAPTAQPTAKPTTRPTTEPTTRPTAKPTNEPTGSTGEFKTVTLEHSLQMLNVRAGAGTNYSLVGQVPHGAQVEVLSTSGEWSQIRYGSVQGYVMSTYLK